MYKKDGTRGCPSWLRTKSVRYWNGAKSTKPKHGTPKRRWGFPLWLTEYDPR